MRTNKSDKVVSLVSQLSVVGLVGHDAERLAKRIQEGQGMRSVESYCNILTNSCRETCESGSFLLRMTGEDIVLYTDKGYAIINYSLGELEYAFTYGEGQSFAQMTKLYQPAEDLDFSDVSDDEIEEFQESRAA